MRRSDREIKDRDAMIQIMEKCDVCRLALNGDGYPYILPLNFGMEIENGGIVLYFHGAAEGTKYDLIAKDSRASFEMDCSHRLVVEQKKDGCSCTMEYESVIGRGRIEILSDEKKHKALCALMKHYHKEEYCFSEAVASQTKVFRLVVSELTGKIRKKTTEAV